MSPSEQLAARLRDEGLQPSAWGNGPGDRYAEHSHAYDKVLVATAGSIVFHLPELGVDVELRTGERLELPADTLHGATVGEQGVNCLEAHLPAGSLGPRPHHRREW
jgi:quercetin dioxygenase-like cupin family protein